MNALGASRVEVPDRSLKFSFTEGRIEVTQPDPTPNMPLESVQSMRGTDEIFTRKQKL